MGAFYFAKMKRYTEKEKQFIIENYNKMTYAEISKFLGRTKDSVQICAERMGLRKNRRETGSIDVEPSNNDEPEIWKDVEGYEGIYMVSSYGRVVSLKRTDRNGTKRNEKIIVQDKNLRGYCRVRLSKDMESKKFSVHTLVAKAFIPNPQNLPQVNHKDENPSNNFYKNLEWCTAKYNTNYGNHNQKVSRTKGRKILQYDMEGNIVKEYCSVGEAAKCNGLNYKQILRCCGEYRKRKDGTSNHVYGNYRWEYKEKAKKSVKTVIQYDLNMNEIAKYSSSIEAANAIGAKPNGIRDCCWGFAKTYYGYKWRYENELQNQSCDD